MQIMTAKITTLRTFYVHVVSNSVIFPQILYDIDLYSQHLTTNKAFKQGSSFCSLTWLNLQNEDPINFASVDKEQSV